MHLWKHLRVEWQRFELRGCSWGVVAPAPPPSLHRCQSWPSDGHREHQQFPGFGGDLLKIKQKWIFFNKIFGKGWFLSPIVDSCSCLFGSHAVYLGFPTYNIFWLPILFCNKNCSYYFDLFFLCKTRHGITVLSSGLLPFKSETGLNTPS